MSSLIKKLSSLSTKSKSSSASSNTNTGIPAPATAPAPAPAPAAPVKMSKIAVIVFCKFFTPPPKDYFSSKDRTDMILFRSISISIFTALQPSTATLHS